ncbi:R3H domain-containing nucleic acid-binding protein [Leifsonia sp. NCR5]|uniref:Jag family protein n=1 Tax=Leifsonia sp. NCR5 TaxID=1978342 RepID=UPI000A18DBAF|nr:R3H domain-containing nucleic acid-binding protein [Leifsonia sp. NCR5]
MTDVQQSESVAEPTSAEVPSAEVDVDVEVAESGASSSAPASSESGDYEQPTADQLDQEGDIAADYIEELLDIADIDGDIDIDARNGRSYISVNADENANLRLLSKPDTVTALQELTRLAVQNKTGSFSRLILDIAGSRDARQAELATLVERAIARIEEGAEQAALPAMSSYERKLVHDIVSERGFVSNSQGEGRDRHTVITKS